MTKRRGPAHFGQCVRMLVAACGTDWTFVGFGLATIMGMVAIGWVIHRDLTERAVDPVRVLVWMFCFWPVGGYLWKKARDENPHPTLRA